MTCLNRMRLHSREVILAPAQPLLDNPLNRFCDPIDRRGAINHLNASRFLLRDPKVPFANCSVKACAFEIETIHAPRASFALKSYGNRISSKIVDRDKPADAKRFSCRITGPPKRRPNPWYARVASGSDRRAPRAFSIEGRMTSSGARTAGEIEEELASRVDSAIAGVQQDGADRSLIGEPPGSRVSMTRYPCDEGGGESTNCVVFPQPSIPSKLSKNPRLRRSPASIPAPSLDGWISAGCSLTH